MPNSLSKPSQSPKPSLVLVRGSRLGKYRLERRIGKGGYCEVWKARDTVEGIWVALKIPIPDITGRRDNETVLREVRLVAQLRHPHIMPVKNAEIIDDHAVLATELSVGTLEGCSKPMGLLRIVRIIRQVLDGLAYAHQKRMVHCDVSPGNIFLFPNGHAAIGDFGIGVELKGRMKTVDEYGTPGYVAPEQAYGRPTYRSDCFSVGLILYEYLTGYLPKWPYSWPFRKVDKLQERAGTDFVKFMRKSLTVDPTKRFINAKQMLTGFEQSLPKSLRKRSSILTSGQQLSDWQQVRRESFVKRYKKVFGVLYSCRGCGEPVAESMQICPWCRSESNRFDNSTIFTHICHRCHKGISGQWSYCPWCYGAGFLVQDVKEEPKLSYQDRCNLCNGKIMRFMKYCPWCHRRIHRPWQVWLFPEICNKCGWSVDTAFWNYCPWCTQRLIP